jgi:hypothetical protein
MVFFLSNKKAGKPCPEGRFSLRVDVVGFGQPKGSMI